MNHLQLSQRSLLSCELYFSDHRMPQVEQMFSARQNAANAKYKWPTQHELVANYNNCYTDAKLGIQLKCSTDKHELVANYKCKLLYRSIYWLLMHCYIAK